MVSRSFITLMVLAPFLVASSCKETKETPGDAAAPTAASVAVPEAGPADLSQCAGCALAAQQAWTFEGIYLDSNCTDPVSQIVVPACGNVPAVNHPISITYTDAIGGRKAGENANVPVVEQVAAATARFRKAGTTCVRANESAVDITPANCAGQKVCRDAQGNLGCTNCRTFANGCPDFEETRFYATITDPVAKGAAPQGGGGGNLGRLKQCCAALAAEAKRLGSSPEGGLLATAAAQCTAVVSQAGPNGTAPELGAMRTLLAGRNVPAVCQGL